MNPIRRATLRLATAALTAPFAFETLADKPYPNRTIQLVVAYPPGGGTDSLARILADGIGKIVGESIVVINRPGAAGLIGTGQVARAAPDGYTLLVDAGNVTLQPAIEPRTPFNPSDFVPVCLATETPAALVVNASLPVSNLEELIAYSRRHPEKLNYASTGQGSPQQLFAELLKVRAKVNWQEIPYQGGAAALADLVAGHTHVMFSNPVPLVPYLAAKRLKVVAVTSGRRLEALHDVPTMKEAGQPDFEFTFWNGMLAPAGTPPEAVTKLAAAMLELLAVPSVKATLGLQGLVVTPLGPSEFQEYLAKDTNRWKTLASEIKYQPSFGKKS